MVGQIMFVYFLTVVIGIGAIYTIQTYPPAGMFCFILVMMYAILGLNALIIFLESIGILIGIAVLLTLISEREAVIKRISNSG